VDSSSVEYKDSNQDQIMADLQGECSYADARTQFVNSTSVECLFTMTPLP